MAVSEPVASFSVFLFDLNAFSLVLLLVLRILFLVLNPPPISFVADFTYIGVERGQYKFDGQSLPSMSIPSKQSYNTVAVSGNYPTRLQCTKTELPSVGCSVYSLSNMNNLHQCLAKI